LNWIRNADISWKKLSNVKIKTGLVLSGEKLIDNIDFRNQLKDMAPDAIGGEMEGAGLYTSCQNERVDWILIKAVCDWADGNKSQDKHSQQEMAAIAASTFVAHVLKVTEL
jgi:nucleoside phosphorylase